MPNQIEDLNFMQKTLSSINDSYPILGEYVVNKAIDFVAKQFKKNKKGKLDLKNDSIEEHFIKEFKHIDILKQYINGILNWSDNENIIKSFNQNLIRNIMSIKLLRGSVVTVTLTH